MVQQQFDCEVDGTRYQCVIHDAAREDGVPSLLVSMFRDLGQVGPPVRFVFPMAYLASKGIGSEAFRMAIETFLRNEWPRNLVRLSASSSPIEAIVELAQS